MQGKQNNIYCTLLRIPLSLKYTCLYLKSLTNCSGRLGLASTSCHTGSQRFMRSSKPCSDFNPKIREPNPRQLVCMKDIRSISMSLSPAEIIAKSTKTLSSCWPIAINRKLYFVCFCAEGINNFHNARGDYGKNVRNQSQRAILWEVTCVI